MNSLVYYENLKYFVLIGASGEIEIKTYRMKMWKNDKSVSNKYHDRCNKRFINVTNLFI